MRRGKFICFMGIDGSGKTTLVNKVIVKCKTEQISLRYVWGAYELRFLRPFLLLAKKVLVKSGSGGQNYKTYVSELNSLGNSVGLGHIYQASTIAEYMSQIIFKIGIPLVLNKHVISDRYLFDTVISMAVNLNMERRKRKRLLRVLTNICPIPDLLFFIDVPEDVAFERKEDTPSIDYIRFRSGLYKETAEEYKAVRLNGTKTVEELTSTVLEALRPLSLN